MELCPSCTDPSMCEMKLCQISEPEQLMDEINNGLILTP